MFRKTVQRAMSTAAASGEATIDGFAKMHAPKLSLFGLHAKYANALYSVASKQNVLEAVEGELKTIHEEIAKNPTFAEFLKDPTIARGEKKADIAKVMDAAKFSKPVSGLFTVLAENGRLGDAKHVIAAYNRLMRAHRGEVQAKITSADPLTKEQLAQVQTALKARIQKGETLLLETVVDPTILGGLKVQIADLFIDLSLSTKIEKIHMILSTRQ
ncbi:ATP synthase F1 [Saprolegnia parasitica CBS 223.65]|uniref:ATP synthase F1 n=1 Tax=Saprolegnia parasitica (strain CBS 223.65) TaxID=695850 RepID=A0A067CRY1_SAPPC|nr:ATP synthase F1 [Saprolegnia parasitica CBS 223.65]KDO33474.1 ATP synthase F1 [Saprolegnia parasitica CBS 223.65]|eukprot:XP_012196218.1 ATP synthase F1 [Saprolegnia parasitica CBS 223.65]